MWEKASGCDYPVVVERKLEKDMKIQPIEKKFIYI